MISLNSQITPPLMTGDLGRQHQIETAKVPSPQYFVTSLETLYIKTLGPRQIQKFT
ncbi:hypothetical protein GFS31_33480 [Leptolyngbya sp. BL0902]|nr:hypothetical protein GFS31_33480 [Leptolyngbya sp. BL0902]